MLSGKAILQVASYAGAIFFFSFLQSTVSQAAQEGEIFCLTGNSETAEKNMRIGGTYSIYLPGLRVSGWPVADKGKAEVDVRFSHGCLTDGSMDTLIEWNDREFGALGRDIVIDLRAEYFIERVEVQCKGKRLHNGGLFLKAQGGRVFVPVRYFDRDDYVDVTGDWRKRTAIIRFDKLGLVAQYIRINVRGSHNPRFAEIFLWGRRPLSSDDHTLTPLISAEMPLKPVTKSREQIEIRTREPVIIPSPQELTLALTPGEFVIRPDTIIIIPEKADERDELTAHLLAEDIREFYGRKLPVKRVANLPSRNAIIPNFLFLCQAPHHPRLKAVKAEGYLLEITPERVIITGRDQVGTFYGTQTLLQLIRYDGKRLSLPCLVIRDWPDWPFRAVRLVPPNTTNTRYMQTIARALAYFKFNRIIHEGLDWAVKWESFPTGYSKAISVKQLKENIAYNQRYFLKTSGSWSIAPATWVRYLGDPSLVEARPGETYLKNGRIEFKRYPGEVLYNLGRVNACPLQPKNLKVFKEAVDEVCSVYKDEYFFGGVDEPLQWYRGSRWGCCELCRGLDPVQLMADWVGKCSDHIRRRHGRIHMYQTTIILKEHQGEGPGYPGGPKIPMYKIIDQMPKERCALVNWSYGVWKRAKGEPDSSGLNRYLMEKGYKEIIQNVGYTNAHFTFAEFTAWGKSGKAEFSGATVANYYGTNEGAMAISGKFLDYVFAADELWSAGKPKVYSRAMIRNTIIGLERMRERIGSRLLPSGLAGCRGGSPGPPFFEIDLSPYFNRSTFDEKAADGKGWIDQGPGLDLRNLPKGNVKLAGFPFILGDPGPIRGPYRGQGRRPSCIMLQNKFALDKFLPERVAGIKVVRRARGLIFLHTTSGPTELDIRGGTAALGGYQINYQDGTKEVAGIQYGRNILQFSDDSVLNPGFNLPGARVRKGWFLYEARPAWLGYAASGEEIILYAYEWVNPHPEKIIAGVDFFTSEEPLGTSPILFAITGIDSVAASLP